MLSVFSSQRVSLFTPACVLQCQSPGKWIFPLLPPVHPNLAQCPWTHLNLGHLLTSGTAKVYPLLLSLWLETGPLLLFLFFHEAPAIILLFLGDTGAWNSFLLLGYHCLDPSSISFLKALCLPGLCLSIDIWCPLWGPAASIVSSLPVSAFSLTTSNFSSLQGNLCS